MKPSFIVILCLILAASIQMHAADHDFARFVARHDAADTVRTIDAAAHPDSFWVALARHDAARARFTEEMARNRRKGERISQELGRSKLFDIEFRPEVDDSLQWLCDSLKSLLCPESDIAICAVSDLRAGAFATHSSVGGVIVIYSGTFEAKGSSFLRVLALAARECAHLWLDHHPRQIKEDIDGYDLNPYVEDFEIGLEQFRTNFTEELEMEADLAALRFMEQAGHSPAEAIAALKLIGAGRTRIDFLNFVATHPELRNTESATALRRTSRSQSLRQQPDPIYD